jgi:membrane-bound lytic murein transglycosylase D
MRSFRYLLSGALVPAILAAPPAATPPRSEPTADELFQLGQQLFDQLAPPEIKAQYEFPSKQQWDEFAVRLQKALQGDDLAALADYAPQARAALPALRLFPEYADYTDWLTARLDELEAAEQIVAPPAARAPARPAAPAPAPAPAPLPRPIPAPPKAPAASFIPHYDLFLARARSSTAPARAAALREDVRRNVESNHGNVIFGCVP